MNARKEKGKVIRMYMEGCNEIESYTLLRLSDAEAEQMTKAANWKAEGNQLVASYESGDALDTLWKDFAAEHQKKHPENFKDVTRRFKAEYPGTSCLVRKPDQHIIYIVLRNDDNTNAINRICLDDQRRNQFFRDVRNSESHKQTGRWALKLSDGEAYTYWSRYMNDVYNRCIERQGKK